jgi:hypothetical protein
MAGGLLAAVAAAAGPEPSREADERPAVPAGSFESAGLAVFVRAHEARRSAGAPAKPSATPLAYSPVTTPGAIDHLQMSRPLQVELPTETGSTGSNWVAPPDQPARPGALAPHDHTDVAAPFARPGLLNTHRTPDLELSVSKRATLGVFGEANTIEPTDIRNSTVRTTRDLGAGVTLQYRFGE